MYQLKKYVPALSLHVLGNENSDYVNQCGYTKNSYLCTNTDFSEKCLYVANGYKSRDCVDCLMIQNNEKCYQAIDSSACYDCKFIASCSGCRESCYLQRCTSCTHCFGCKNLTNKHYCIFDIQYSSDEYQKKVQPLLSNINAVNFKKFLQSADIVSSYLL